MTELDLEFECGVLGFGSPALLLASPSSPMDLCVRPSRSLFSLGRIHSATQQKPEGKKTPKNERETTEKAQLFHHDAGKKLPLITGASPQL